MANIIMFCIFAVVIVASSMMCVTTTRIMRAATFMLFMLVGVAGLYFLLDYTYLGATQLAVYAGGVTMIFAFAIQLVSKRSLQGTIERIKLSRVAWGGVLCIISCAVVVLVLLKNQFMYAAMAAPDVEVPVKQIGMALVGTGKYQYVLPFEFISLFLLACIIGGLVVSRKEEE